MTEVWADLVGQDALVETLRQAVAGAERRLNGEPAAAMTHAWLLTGPPGSGRSNAARAFAAALQCPTGGCGTCPACRTALAGTHADVTLVRTDELSHGVDDIRAMVRRAALTPSGRRWQVVVLEDADRLTERAADALLKAVEEPAARTVWLLCTPSAEDLEPTIRSRCRHVVLATPSTPAVAEFLVHRYDVPEALAVFAARAAQGHVGRARALATDEQARIRRHEVLSLPTQLADVGSCLVAAANLVESAAEDARQLTAALEAGERAEVEPIIAVAGRGRSRATQSVLKDLEARQRSRATRVRRDFLDRALVDLVSFYRDVLLVQLSPDAGLVNEELREDITVVAHRSSPEDTLRRIDAVLACREAVQANVAPLLAVEAMALALYTGQAAADRVAGK